MRGCQRSSSCSIAKTPLKRLSQDEMQIVSLTTEEAVVVVVGDCGGKQRVLERQNSG